MACEIKDKIDALNSLLELRSVKNNSKIHGVIQAKRDVLVAQLDKTNTDFRVPKRFRSKVIDSIGKHVDTRIQALKNKDGQDLAPWLMPKDVIFAMRVTEKMVNFVEKLGLDAVKNFGNPFMLSALKDSNNKIDRAIAKQNGEASEMFYNWLKDGTIPATYDGDLDALAKRREFILQNLGKVNKAKAIHYKGTAKGDDVNHAKALSLLAKQVADGEVVIADVNTDDVTIAASAPETIVSTKSSTKKTYVNHSGGAVGSDTVWGEIGEKFGVKSNHYWYSEKTPNGNSEISEVDAKEGQQKATAAARQMGRIEETHNVRDNKIIRNWSQVKYADAIFAVTTMLSVGTLMNHGKKALIRQGKGGTGYAIQMAINEGKPVYVFDQERNRWFKNINGKWENSEVPVLTTNFAGIGTRKINANGMKAIDDVYEKTFKERSDDKYKEEKEEDRLLKEVGYQRDDEIDTNEEEAVATDKFTVPENIVTLKENEVFVFGSNRAGNHGKGAALTAKEKFGAEQGVGSGPTGQTYAIPTKDDKLNTLSYDSISTEIEDFIEYAERNPDKTFLVTAIGTGLAGLKAEHILYYFNNAPVNIKLPKKWANVVPSKPQNASRNPGIVVEGTNKANDDIIKVEGINGTTKEMLPGDTAGLSSEFLQQMNEEKCQ